MCVSKWDAILGAAGVVKVNHGANRKVFFWLLGENKIKNVGGQAGGARF